MDLKPQYHGIEVGGPYPCIESLRQDKNQQQQLGDGDPAAATWSRLTTGSMQLTTEAVRACIPRNRGLQQLCMRWAAQFVCNPVRIVSIRII